MGQKFGMGARFNNLAVLHHKNPLAVYGSCESVRNQDDGSIAAQTLQSLSDRLLVLQVQRIRGFVEDEYGSLSDERSCDS
jgi:hypothetical protein